MNKTIKSKKIITPLVGVIMGSKSDWETMKAACEALDKFGIAYEKKVVSAHRTPEVMCEYAKSAQMRGLKVIIAGAGGAAHLPGMVAAMTVLPVIGVPVVVAGSGLGGVDALYSIVQMPKGVPVACVAIGGAWNAGVLAVRVVGSNDEAVSRKLSEYAKEMQLAVAGMKI